MVKKSTKKVTPKKKPKKKIIPKISKPAQKFLKAQRLITLQTIKGDTDAQVAEVLGITKTTYENWKKKYPEFFDSVKESKQQSDSEVVQALRSRAVGFSRMIKHSAYDQKTSKLNEWEEEVYYPPETKACEFWLTNRQKEEWKRIKHVDVTTLGDQLPVPIINVTNNQTKVGLNALNNE